MNDTYSLSGIFQNLAILDPKAYILKYKWYPTDFWVTVKDLVSLHGNSVELDNDNCTIFIRAMAKRLHSEDFIGIPKCDTIEEALELWRWNCLTHHHHDDPAVYHSFQDPFTAGDDNGEHIASESWQSPSRGEPSSPVKQEDNGCIRKGAQNVEHAEAAFDAAMQRGEAVEMMMAQDMDIADGFFCTRGDPILKLVVSSFADLSIPLLSSQLRQCTSGPGVQMSRGILGRGSPCRVQSLTPTIGVVNDYWMPELDKRKTPRRRTPFTIALDIIGTLSDSYFHGPLPPEAHLDQLSHGADDRNYWMHSVLHEFQVFYTLADLDDNRMSSRFLPSSERPTSLQRTALLVGGYSCHLNFSETPFALQLRSFIDAVVTQRALTANDQFRDQSSAFKIIANIQRDFEVLPFLEEERFEEVLLDLPLFLDKKHHWWNLLGKRIEAVCDRWYQGKDPHDEAMKPPGHRPWCGDDSSLCCLLSLEIPSPASKGSETRDFGTDEVRAEDEHWDSLPLTQLKSSEPEEEDLGPFPSKFVSLPDPVFVREDQAELNHAVFITNRFGTDEPDSPRKYSRLSRRRHSRKEERKDQYVSVSAKSARVICLVTKMVKRTALRYTKVTAAPLFKGHSALTKGQFERLLNSLKVFNQHVIDGIILGLEIGSFIETTQECFRCHSAPLSKRHGALSNGQHEMQYNSLKVFN
ncbi:hypothetical protein C8J56DRAFT_1132360 [Mycena floridula]|nr:hypothetical protein C8J56DRAFT_1132360 [Mycena floridula]